MHASLPSTPVLPRTLSTRQFYWLLILPAVVMMAGFYVYPLLKVLWKTARISLITTATTPLLGYVVAYAMVHASAGQLRWLTFFVLLPLWISVLVRAFAWVTLLRSNGLINTGLQQLDLIDAPIALLRNEIGVMIGMVHYMIPFAVLPLYAKLRGIDLRLVAAARGLGASAWQAFARVFLPLSMPGIVGAGVLVFIFSLGFYVTPAILGGGRVLMVSEYIGVQILNTIRWRLASRSSEWVRSFMLLPLVVPSIVYAIGVYRLFVELRLLDSFTGVVLTHIVTGLPYVVITVSASFATFDPRLEQAARNLGASLWQTVRRVIVPNIMPGVASGAIFAFIHSWDETVIVLFVAGRSVYTLPRRMWNDINENLDPVIAAVAVGLIFVTLLMLLAELALRARRSRTAA